MAGAVVSGRPGHDPSGFLHRLVRLDPDAVVRLRPATTGETLLWGRLPWGVLVCQPLDWAPAGDRTVPAAVLLAEAEGGQPRPPGEPRPTGAAAVVWREPLPSGPGELVEVLAGTDVRMVAQRAAESLRSVVTGGVGGRVVGQRAVRDALLDHVPFVVDLSDRRIEISQRIVQAVVRMGFLGPGSVPSDVKVRVLPGWIALATPYGAAWRRTANPLSLRITR